MPNPPAPPNTVALQAFIAQLMPIAQRYGIGTIIIAARDPVSNDIGIFGSVESMGELRDAVEAKFTEKLGAVAETAWE
jgi:hypothetical protein